MLAVAEETKPVLVRCRAAQEGWARTSLPHRLRIVRRIRNELAASSNSLLAAFPFRLRRNLAERLAAELIPLAEACRFLEKQASTILATRTLPPRRRPFWLRGIAIEERRDPIGVVLIIGPANYPLFLPGVHALQALVAGNAVVIKPGRGGCPVMQKFHQATERAGLPNDLLIVLGEDTDAAESLIAEGVDKIVLTGSSDSGRAVYRQAADKLTPLTLELSGCDPVFVQAGADLKRAVSAIAFGVRWNGGDTCIAPRRVFVAARIAARFERLLQEQVPEAVDHLPVTSYETDEQALDYARLSYYALGASVFGQPGDARAFAAKIHAGVVVVNDMIMPTADPRVAFGGRGQSGFGVTRGAEGLRQFTALKTIIVQSRKRLRHLEPLPPHAQEVFTSYLSASYSSALGTRLRAWLGLYRTLWKGRRNAS
jgi:acyl-CoA reductase-like NAD-dependent aldehyde dehydrogenase